jgi:thiol-disulfide isomerase/thioredoxin
MMKMIRAQLFRFVVGSLLLVAASVQADSENYTFTDLHGNPVKLADYKGKWVVVNYWATWCPPCLAEIPELVHFHETHKDVDAVVLGMNMEEVERESLVSFVDDNMMSYPVVPMSREMPLLGAVPGLPTTYLLDPQGKPAAVQVGEVTQEMLEEFMAKYGQDR